MAAREFVHKGWRVVIDDGVVAISNKPACDQAREEVLPTTRLELQRVVVPDDLIDAISDALPPRSMRSS